jgi:hypothetical protein
MAKTRYTGKGALVKANVSGDTTTMVAVGLCTSVTPPPLVKAAIDCTGMEDTTPVVQQGIEQLSEFTFECLHDPDDAGDDGVETLYGNGKAVKWQIITVTVNSSGTTKTWTKDFLGVVTGINPSQFSGGDSVRRSVTVQRVGAVTDTAV